MFGLVKKIMSRRRIISHPASITSNNSTGNNNELDKSFSEKITHENLFIIGDIEKCKKVMAWINADDSYSEEEVTIYNKEIIDNNWHNTFKFYLCGNVVVECEKIYKSDKQRSSYFFFFVDMTEGNSLNKLEGLLLDFKQKFGKEISRFFLILLKTDSQGERIRVEEAKKFCDEKRLKFFGVIDSQNIMWDFEEKESFYSTIVDIELYEGEESDYKLREMKNNEESDRLCYEVKKDYDIWGMFLCGIKYQKINTELIHKAYMRNMQLTGYYY